eukprot:2605378-Prorocentrum_lima.AAC.1
MSSVNRLQLLRSSSRSVRAELERVMAWMVWPLTSVWFRRLRSSSPGAARWLRDDEARVGPR